MTNKLSSLQLYMLVMLESIGLGIILSPMLGSLASVTLGCVLAFIICCILIDKRIDNIRLRWLYIAIKYMYFIKLIVITAFTVRFICNVFMTHTGDKINIYMLSLIIFLCCIYAASKGIKSIARTAVLVGIPIVVIIFAGLLSSVRYFSTDNFQLDLISANPIEVLMIGLSIGIPDLILWLKSEKSSTAVFASSIGIITVFIVELLLVGCFGEGQIRLSALRLIYSSPMLNIFNRNDGLYIGIWLFSAVIYCAVSYSVAERFTKNKFSILFFAIAIVAVMLLPIDFESFLKLYGAFCAVTGLIFTVVLPIFLMGRSRE